VRGPLLDLDREDVILQLRTQELEDQAKLTEHIWIYREPLPVTALTEHMNPSPDEIKISPTAADNLRAAQPDPFHEQDRRALVHERRRPQPTQLVQRRPVDLGLSFPRATDLARGVGLDDVFRLGPGEERSQDGGRRGLLLSPKSVDPGTCGFSPANWRLLGNHDGAKMAIADPFGRHRTAASPPWWWAKAVHPLGQYYSRLLRQTSPSLPPKGENRGPPRPFPLQTGRFQGGHDGGHDGDRGPLWPAPLRG
jgi:hypothetical protein